MTHTWWTTGEVLVAGSTEGPLLTLQEPLSFWGGVDDDGVIVDRHHPQVGASLSGTVLLVEAIRGSSSSTSTLLECIRRGTAPSVLLLADGDPILVIAAVAALELYDRAPTVVRLRSVPPEPVADGAAIRVDEAGHVWVAS